MIALFNLLRSEYVEQLKIWVNFYYVSKYSRLGGIESTGMTWK